MGKKLRLLRSANGNGYLYMVAPTDAALGQSLLAPTDTSGGSGGTTAPAPTTTTTQPVTDTTIPTSTVTPTTDGGPAVGPIKDTSSSTFTPSTDPNDPINQDFYSMDCSTLLGLINNIQSILNGARLVAGAADYYNTKLAQAQSAYSARCGGIPSSPPTLPTSPSASSPVVPATQVNVGDTTGLNPGGFTSPLSGGAGGGAGGGGGSDSSKPAAKKKTNWWLWALALGAFGLALYKTRNGVTKLPG